MIKYLIDFLCVSAGHVLSNTWIQVCRDSSYILWLFWTFFPFIACCFLMPLILLALLLGTGLFLYSYSFFRQDRFAGCRQYVAMFWYLVGRVWNGHEVIGWEKIPKNRGAMIVYYHGTLPYDMYYLLARLLVSGQYGQPIPVVDRFLVRLWGFRSLISFTGAETGTVDSIAEWLRAGRLVTLSPGGVREALFSDEYYSVLWGKRCGFARAAIKGNAPIYPMFTENCRECIRMVQIVKEPFRKLYEYLRFPIGIPYGFFPVKFKSYIGDPILPMEGESAEELAKRVKATIVKMIETHQRRPGNIILAMLQRIPILDRLLRHFR